ncbi:hypothetical protein [Vibrio viridaestus]|uniref:Uncharacterized protein n=1 Tax=Vibrio viridaestus TaxID=2487322 RepID=A0A3N9TH03_9VIBR|nr:hypothetical protein [Vibrio viridaestus]RQW63469.1 hypothetical protein EES38_09485 [Vibrio viridaestus]
MTVTATKLKEDFYRQIEPIDLKPSTGNGSVCKATVSFLTEEEIRSLAKVWVELVLWQQKQSR